MANFMPELKWLSAWNDMMLLVQFTFHQNNSKHCRFIISKQQEPTCVWPSIGHWVCTHCCCCCCGCLALPTSASWRQIKSTPPTHQCFTVICEFVKDTLPSSFNPKRICQSQQGANIPILIPLISCEQFVWVHNTTQGYQSNRFF